MNRTVKSNYLISILGYDHIMFWYQGKNQWCFPLVLETCWITVINYYFWSGSLQWNDYGSTGYLRLHLTRDIKFRLTLDIFYLWTAIALSGVTPFMSKVVSEDVQHSHQLPNVLKTTVTCTKCSSLRICKDWESFRISHFCLSK